MDSEQRIVILGGGYAGLALLRQLAKRLPLGLARVQLIDASGRHAIKSRFHERAVSPLREPGISLPLAPLARAARAIFTRDEILGVDFANQRVAGRRGEYCYDLLVLALGGRADFHGISGAEEHTHPVDTLETVRSCAKSLGALVDRKGTEPRRVVVCGAGIEGIEVATQIRQANRDRLEVLLVEGGEQVLPRAAYPSERAHTLAHLERKGIPVLLGRRIGSFTAGAVHLTSGEALSSDLSIWCGGVSRPALAGLEGRRPLEVDRHLRSLRHPEVFAIGDCAALVEGDRFANLASAQRAVYQGELCARNVANLLLGKPLAPARYRPIGELVALGDWDGVGEVMGVSVSGAAAAVLKKGNEGKYLAEVTSQLPRFTARLISGPVLRLLGSGRGNTPT